MNGLFGEESHFPPGFSYYPEFISGQEEAALLAAVREAELRTFVFQGFEARRKTASFGLDYRFDQRRLSPGKAIPAAFDALIAKVAVRLHKRSEDLAAMLLTEYPPGSVINWHRDAPPFDTVAGISLLTSCVFRFRLHAQDRPSRHSIRSFIVAPRSLYVMQGEAREQWQHSIAPVKATRYSVTLRTLKHGSSF